MNRVVQSFVLIVLSAGFHVSAFACPSCYGAADSSLTQGMNAAILVMLGITGCVLALFCIFFTMLWRRTRLFHPPKTDTSFVNDKGVLQWNNS